MGLVDASLDRYFNTAKERWMLQGFDADITDILNECRGSIRGKVSRDKVNILTSFLIQLYDYNHIELQKDVTKLILLEPTQEYSMKDKRKLLGILWSTIQRLSDDDLSLILNEINRLAEWNKANNEEDFPIK